MQDLWLAHYQISLIILLNEFVELNVNMGMRKHKIATYYFHFTVSLPQTGCHGNTLTLATVVFNSQIYSNIESSRLKQDVILISQEDKRAKSGKMLWKICFYGSHFIITTGSVTITSFFFEQLDLCLLEKYLKHLQ